MHVCPAVVAGRIWQTCAGGKVRRMNGTWTGFLDSGAPGKALMTSLLDLDLYLPGQDTVKVLFIRQIHGGMSVYVYI